MKLRTIALPQGPVPTSTGPFLCAPAPIEMPGALHQRRGDGPIFARALGAGFKAVAGEVTEIEIYDEIGWYGVSASQIRERLKGAGDVVVRINSPGGDVFDGITIFNDLLRHPGQVRVEVNGLAASAASVIAMAGSHLAIAENAFLMIHNAWTIEMGDRRQMEATAKVLGQIDGQLAATYAARSNLSVAEASELMDAETWLTAEAAVEQGLADEVRPFAEPQAAFDLGLFNKAPDALRLYSRAARGDISTRDLERGLRDAGRSGTQAKREASALASLAQRDVAPDRHPPRQRDAAERERIAAALAKLSNTMELQR